MPFLNKSYLLKFAIPALLFMVSGCFEDKEATARSIAEKISIAYRNAEAVFSLDTNGFAALKVAASDLDVLMERYADTEIVKDIMGNGELFGFTSYDFMARLRDATYYNSVSGIISSGVEDIAGFELSKTCGDCVFGGDIARVINILAQSRLVDTVFLDAKVGDASFYDATLDRVKFVSVDAQGADFSESDINGAGVAAFFPLRMHNSYSREHMNRFSLEDIYRQTANMPDFINSNFRNSLFNNTAIKGIVFLSDVIDGSDFSGSSFQDIAFVDVSAQNVSLHGIQVRNEVISREDDVRELIKRHKEDGPLTFENSVYNRSYGGGYGTHYTREGRILIYDSDFSGSDFTGINAFSRLSAVFEGFQDGDLTIIGSRMDNSNFARTPEAWHCRHEININRSSFAGAKFSGCSVTFNLDDVSLDWADFTGSDVTFRDVLTRLSAREASFIEANVNFRAIDSVYADSIKLDFRGADFSRAVIKYFGDWRGDEDFKGANFSEATMIDAVFDGMSMVGQAFDDSKLNNASFVGADLTDADFGGASLKGSNLTNANLSKANLLGADLSNAIISNTNFCGAIGPNGEQMMLGCRE